MTVVLGLDLSLRSTGWALVDFDDATAVEAGVIETKPALELSERLALIADSVLTLVDEWTPIEIGVEAPFAARSGTTTIRLGMVHGAVRLACWRRCIAPAEVTPATLKHHATGRGNADKTVMQARALARFGVTVGPDEADALWVADWARVQAWERIGEA